MCFRDGAGPFTFSRHAEVYNVDCGLNVNRRISYYNQCGEWHDYVMERGRAMQRVGGANGFLLLTHHPRWMERWDILVHESEVERVQ